MAKMPSGSRPAQPAAVNATPALPDVAVARLHYLLFDDTKGLTVAKSVGTTAVAPRGN